MTKENILKIIDEVMNNREIDSIRNAILAIRDKVIETHEDEAWNKEYFVKLKLRGRNPLSCHCDYFDGATHIVIDTSFKNDTNDYGAYWYE